MLHKRFQGFRLFAAVAGTSIMLWQGDGFAYQTKRRTVRLNSHQQYRMTGLSVNRKCKTGKSMNPADRAEASLEASLNKQLRKAGQITAQGSVFGRKSETKKVVYPEEQMSLFNEAETEAKPSAPEPEISVKPHKRKKKVGHREELLAKLPHQKIVVEPETTVCRNVAALSPVGAKNSFVRKSSTSQPAWK